jgi:hypothetical protein
VRGTEESEGGVRYYVLKNEAGQYYVGVNHDEENLSWTDHQKHAVRFTSAAVKLCREDTGLRAPEGLRLVRLKAKAA